MSKDTDTEKAKKILFSKDIDSKINGFALVLSFVTVGLFLTYNKNYFSNQTITEVFRWIFIVIGILGFIGEMSSFKNSAIKGMGDFFIGLLCIGIWFTLFSLWNIWYVNVIGFFFFVIGLYGTFRGCLEIGYSMKLLYKTKGKRKSSIFTDVLLLITQILGVALIIAQIIQVVGSIKL